MEMKNCPSVSKGTKKVPFFRERFVLSFAQTQPGRFVSMAANQVVVYFEKEEDALRFTLAASSVLSADNSEETNMALVNVGEGISKASRITAEGSLHQRVGG
jgi:hypothetical protein